MAAARFPSVSGQYTVKEALRRRRVCRSSSRRIWAYLLSVNGSYRYSDYSIDQTTNSYGLGIEWAPVRDYKLRGTYQQAVRAPNIIELFTPQGLNLFNTRPAILAVGPNGPDRDAGGLRSVRTRPVPIRGGWPHQSGGPVQLPAGRQREPPPETAKTYTIGLVMTPWTQFSATIDYWNIDLKDQISIIPSALALNSCVTDGTFCDLIHRDPISGSLWRGDNGYVIGTNINIGAQKHGRHRLHGELQPADPGLGQPRRDVGRNVPQHLRNHADPGRRLVRLRRPLRPDLRHAAAGLALQAAWHVEHAVAT